MTPVAETRPPARVRSALKRVGGIAAGRAVIAAIATASPFSGDAYFQVPKLPSAGELPGGHYLNISAKEGFGIGQATGFHPTHPPHRRGESPSNPARS